jgi:hypothetical protein
MNKTKQLELNEFKEFKPICEQYEKDVNEIRAYRLRLIVNYEAKKLKLRNIKIEIGNFPDKLFCSKFLGVIYIDKEYLKLPYEILKLMLIHELNHIKIYRLLRNNPKIEQKLQNLEDKNITEIFEKLKVIAQKELNGLSVNLKTDNQKEVKKNAKEQK